MHPSWEKAYRHKYYEDNKAAYLRRDKEARQRKRAVIQAAKDKPCADCGGRFPVVVMDFDHRGDKKFTIGRDYGKVGMRQLRREIAKCEVVCANCHRLRSERVRSQRGQRA